jgi:cell division protein FtsN
VAARRNKSQAKRNQSNGMPGWAWMVLGILLTLIVILVAPKYLKSEGDGFFRPQPNPDAQPAPVSSVDDEVIAPVARPVDTAATGADDATDKERGYDFYTLLPGKETPMTDAELAATERAESQRLAEIARQQGATTARPDDASLPRPVDTEPAPSATASRAPAASATATAPANNSTTAAGAGDGSRYLLQAGAFQASGQAEELKAKIALLGLGARVESAEIKGKTIYRVRMGPYGTASDLADAKRKLESGGMQPLAIKVQ